jgi:S-adenosylmethionine:tRNA ribosyltransferase-isomerase
MFLDYHLPPERIAQRAIEPRDSARLLVARRETQAIEHRRVSDLPELLDGGDLLVVNDSRVLPARIIGKRANTGGKWEGLYLNSTPDGLWEMLCQTRGTLGPGERIDVEPGMLQLTLVERSPDRPWKYRPDLRGPAVELLERFGRVPLPPYIRKGVGDESDLTRYQTIYAVRPGSVAAPTAGLHFTPELLARLREKGIERTAVTLHVGLGTFQPVAAVVCQIYHVFFPLQRTLQQPG